VQRLRELREHEQARIRAPGLGLGQVAARKPRRARQGREREPARLARFAQARAAGGKQAVVRAVHER